MVPNPPCRATQQLTAIYLSSLSGGTWSVWVSTLCLADVTNTMALWVLAISLLVVGCNSLINIQDRSVDRYLGDSFLLPDGCPVDDPMIQRCVWPARTLYYGLLITLLRFYKLCLASHGADTLCSTDRFPNGRSLTIPQFSNICSAICHNMPEEEMNLCPYKGRVMGDSPFNRRTDLGEGRTQNLAETVRFGRWVARTESDLMVQSMS